MQELSHFQQRFTDYLQSRPFRKSPVGLYEPVDYILSLGGKRLRPAVLLCAHHLFADDWERALPAALGVEVFHNFTLLHDDIMDQSPLRRGKPTVHERWNSETAILSGDVMMIQSYELLRETGSERLNRLLEVFNRTAIEVCEGQQMDMDFERRNDVTVEEYVRMIELKTSVLFGAALQLGALLGGAGEEDAQHLYDFGRNLGIAFQIQDDYLDTFGTAAQVGKRIGGDILRNKKTYLAISARNRALGDLATELHEWYADDTDLEDDKIARVTQIFRKLGVERIANEAKESYYEKAMAHLAQVQSPHAERKQLLEQLAKMLIHRNR